MGMDLSKILNTKNKYIKLFTRTLWVLLFAGVVLLPLYVYTVSLEWGIYGGLPSLKALENPENDLSSQLISADEVSLGSYFRYNRSPVSFEDLSPELVKTLISSEDHRFYEHSGIDLRGLLRAAWGVITANRNGGGSTITMQLAENLFNTMTANEGSLYKVPGVKDVVIKTKEWIIAAQLERNFTKEEIIAMYLNTVSFGSGAFGIKTASETFFGKTPDSLNYQESAMIVGLLQGTTTFNPVRNYDRSVSKRNEVLRELYKHEHVSRKELDSLRALPIDLSNYNVANQNKGPATYFRSVIKPYLVNWAKDHGYDLYEDGLKIYTTIDSKMQQYAEDAVTRHMTNLQKDFDEHWEGQGDPWRDLNGRPIPNYIEKKFKGTERYRSLVEKYGKDSDSLKIVMNLPVPMKVFSWSGEKDTLLSPLDSMRYYKHFLQAGMMSMDPHTGHIKAWVGGIDHKYFKYDHVKQGRRQPGSTFKPFVYGAAIEQGFAPCFVAVDVPITFEVPGDPPTWTPPNADGKYTGEKMTIRKAMANSVNSITAFLMQKVKPENVVTFAKNVGIESPLDAVPSLCLGTSDVSVYELVGAYSTFANQGIYTQPHFLSHIEDKNGNVIENFVPKTRQAISQQTAYKMIYMLRGGVEEEGGTSRGLSANLKIDNEIGGKTGTTNNASDGWYMGVTKDLVTGIWVGGDERTIHFRSWVLGQGGKTARPIWDYFMTSVYADKDLGYEKGPFKRPAGGIDVVLDCEKYNVSDDSVDVAKSVWDDNFTQ